MTVTMDIRIVFLFLFFIVFLVVAGFVVVAILKIMKAADNINKLVVANAENVSETLELLPYALKSVGDGAQSLKDTSDKVGDVVDTIETNVCQTITNVTEGADGVVGVIRVVGEVAKGVMSMVQDFRK